MVAIMSVFCSEQQVRRAGMAKSRVVLHPLLPGSFHVTVLGSNGEVTSAFVRRSRQGDMEY